MSEAIPQRREVVIFADDTGSLNSVLVLSDKAYNSQTGLLVGCYVGQSERGSITNVPITISGEQAVIISSSLHTLKWGGRELKILDSITQEDYESVLYRIIPLIGGESLFND